MEDQQNLQRSLAEMELNHPGDPPLQDDDVVITGMSSLMPGCENLKEWADKLYKKENMVTSDNPRWKYKHPELSPYLGQAPGVDRFDAQFFMVNANICHFTEPVSRKLLEQTYQALFDAGVCPAEVSGKRIGVFVAVSQCESEKFSTTRVTTRGLIGCNRAMFANRISYWMNITGPSLCIDAACSGAVVALEKAQQDIKNGLCEAALVGAASFNFHPMTLIHRSRLAPQNYDGKTKCYDINADGQSISDSVTVMYLQKYKDARRVYARLCLAKTEFSQGFDEKYGYYRDPEILSKFLSNFYDGVGVSPSSVEYVEGFGLAHPNMDKSELQAIEKVLCQERIEPLLVGSVTSNMGFTDAVSGLNGIIKILHGYQNGVLAANLNCDNPRLDISAIRDGRMKILTEHQPICRSYAAVNNFSVTGVNGHVLLKGHYKNKNTSKYSCDIPYLVTISGRQESGVEKILNSIKSNNLDPEELALLREIYKIHTPSHLARGFGVFSSVNTKTVALCENVNSYDEMKRPLWFVYSGMGSQWTGMGTQLMSIPTFAATILRSGQPITADFYCAELQTMMVKLAEKQSGLINRSLPLLPHDNARPHTVRGTVLTLQELQLEYHPSSSLFDELGSKRLQFFSNLRGNKIIFPGSSTLFDRTSYTVAPIFDLIHHLAWTQNAPEVQQRCDKVLKPKGINIVDIITSDDKTTFDNILNAFVGITAIQIALTDVLLAVGLVPDKMIGHSMGELGCAYADKCLTAEETILLSYCRGLVSVQLPFIKGSMAAVGLGYKEISKLCPSEIQVACHNGPDSSTLSGPAEIMQKFVKELSDQGIFAKEVNCANIAYHSRYIAEAGPVFLEMGQAIIKVPKVRSKRWLSTSVPVEEWKQYAALYSSAEYHTNNLLNPVLFEETSRYIPNGAILVEIAPHGLLQAILKRSLSDCKNIALTNRGSPNPCIYLLEAIGKLYVEGCDVDTRALYPKVEFPVSTKTPQLSHLVEHSHSDRWKICQYTSPERRFSSTYKPIVTLYDDEYTYLNGSIVQGKRQFPFAGILMFAWDVLAMSLEKKRRKISVLFQDVIFYHQPLLEDHRKLEFTIMLHKGTGKFEVLEDPNILIAEGTVEATSSTTLDTLIDCPNNDDEFELSSTDVYKLLNEKGFEYTRELRSIQRASLSLTKAEIEWMGNWTTFMDGIFQMISLRQEYNGVSRPSCVKKIVIDIDKHEGAVLDNKGVIEANHYEVGDVTRCGGVFIKTVIWKAEPAFNDLDIGLKTLKFVPYIQENTNISTNLYVSMQIIAENLGTNTIKVLTINENTRTNHLKKIRHLLDNEPEIKIELSDLHETEVIRSIREIVNPNLVYISNEVYNKEIFNQLYLKLSKNTFLLMIGVETNFINTKMFKSILIAGKKGTKLELFKWIQPQRSESIVFSVKNNLDLVRLRDLRKDLSLKQSLTVITTYPPIPGVKEIVKKMRAEASFQAHLAMINCKKPEFDLRKLHNMPLTNNTFQNGKWGGEYYVPLEEFASTRENVTLQIGKLGNFNSLHWVEMCKDENTSSIPITVHYAGLSVLDAKGAVADISSKICSGFGMDFSGLNERQEPVMGLIAGGAASSKIDFKSGLLWPIPKHWSMEDAATVPLPYCLAFYCLGIKQKLVRGMNILIHGGAGALGQAAISIALAHGCTIFSTVSDNGKKQFLRKLFPDLPANHIGNSRDDSFRDMVQSLTNSEGCDIIISNVKENLKNATLTCCAMSGTTLDMVQIHNRDMFQYGMSFMTKSRSYCPINFSSVFSNDNGDDLKKLQCMVSDGIIRGYVRPLSRISYAPCNVPHAFHLLAASRHRGRVLLQLQDQQISARTKMTCLPESSYLIICDKDGLGLKLADKLVSNGAKKIHLHLTWSLPHLLYKHQSWKKNGVKINVSSTNLEDDDNLNTLMDKINNNGPMDGIFIIQDETFPIKASVLSNLDNITRKQCVFLRYFLVVNGQDIAQDICHKRLQNGIPGVSIKIPLKKFDEKNEGTILNGMNWNNAIKVIETVAKAKVSNALAYVKYDDIRKHINKENIQIKGVTIPNTIIDESTLEGGIDHATSQEFCFPRENKSNYVITKIPNSKTGQSKYCQMERKVFEKKKPGIEEYFSSIHSDELVANSELVLMPTKLIKADMRSDELEIEESHMFIIPGLEGHHEKFKTLCKQLKIATAVLQLGYDNQNETILETAQRLSKLIMHKLKYKTHFYLLGYEYGVLVVLEIAAILEKYGLSGTVFCLGGSPKEVRADVDNRVDGMAEWKLQNKLIQHFFSLASDGDTADLEINLLKLQSFNDKVLLCLKMLQGRIPYNSQYLSDIIKSAYARIGFIRHYNCKVPRLKAKIILIRALPPIISNFPVTARYELPVSIPYAPNDLQCSAIINKHLELNVLEDYCSRNICDSYLMNMECEEYMMFGLPDSHSDSSL